MIDPITGAALTDAIIGINTAMQGQSITDAYNDRITGQYSTDDGPTIGYADFTSDVPAITGDTSGSISDGTPNADPVDSWHDYVENTPTTTVSDTTGGIVSGSTAGTFVYSLMEENPGTAVAVAKAIVPVAVPVDAAITAISQAVGVSIDIVNLDIETKRTITEAYVSAGGVIYDKARGLVTAWKDELGRILFPKKALDSVYDVVGSWGDSEEYVDYDDVDVSVLNYPNFNYQLYPVPAAWSHEWGAYTDGFSVVSGNPYSFYLGEQGFFAFVSDQPFSVTRILYPYTTNSVAETKNGITYYVCYANINFNTGLPDFPVSNIIPGPGLRPNASLWDTAYLLFNGTIITPGYPDGTSQSQTTSYTPSTIPIAGNLATSYDPNTGILGTEPLVPIHLTDDPYDSTGDTVDPTDPTDDDNPGLVNPPIPLPIPDTRPSNPNVPLVNPSVVDSTRVAELVEELANTLDPQPGQSSGVIPIPQLPGITDPDTGQRTFPSIIPDSGPGFIHVYNPTPAEFVAFGSWLWVTYADATIDKILNNPFDGVIGAHELYATPNRGGRDNIRSAFLVCPTTADLVPNRYSEIDCGTVIVPEFYGNYLDYSPYSQAYIYLPFIGINEVSIDDIVGHAVNIRYRVDSYSGACIAMIFVAKDGYQNLCYQFAGSCSVEVPMAGGSQAAIKAGMMQAEAYARAAMVSAAGHLLGGIGSAFMGSIGGAITNIAGIAGDYANAKAGVEAARVANKSSVQHSGQFGASHGAMGQKIPFIIIRNPIQVKVVNYNDDYGFPAHKRVIVGGCTGYLRVREVNVVSAHATDAEKAAIELMLKNGVYVS